MTLAEYLANHEPVAAFAQRLGVSTVTINRYINQRRFPDKQTVEAIARLTAGKVQPADWYDVSRQPARIAS